jgi:uncharacterized repeat protein (TIGR01451 family)
VPYTDIGVIYPVAGDTVPVDNYDTLNVITTSSFDPNMKEVYPSGDLDVAAVSAGTELEYTVHFQNTGTAPALNITVYDEIDGDLDLSTFTITGSSHPITSYNIEPNRLLRVTYQNINLPDSNANEPGSHGLFSYTIQPYNNLPVGQVISNTAFIYFDNNQPVVTNTTLNTVVIPTFISTPANQYSLEIYPNPADRLLTISHPAGYENFEILNTLGQTVKTGNLELSSGKHTISIDELPSGMFYIRLTSLANPVRINSFVINR